MIYRNNTDFPESILMRILHFVAPCYLLECEGEIYIKNQYQNHSTAGLFRSHRRKRFFPTIIIFREKDWSEEVLIAVLAHELRHMWQYYFFREFYYVKDFAEDDADSYAAAMVRTWRENQWN